MKNKKKIQSWRTITFEAKIQGFGVTPLRGVTPRHSRIEFQNTHFQENTEYPPANTVLQRKLKKQISKLMNNSYIGTFEAKSMNKVIYN